MMLEAIPIRLEALSGASCGFAAWLMLRVYGAAHGAWLQAWQRRVRVWTRTHQVDATHIRTIDTPWPRSAD